MRLSFCQGSQRRDRIGQRVDLRNYRFDLTCFVQRKQISLRLGQEFRMVLQISAPITTNNRHVLQQDSIGRDTRNAASGKADHEQSPFRGNTLC